MAQAGNREWVQSRPALDFTGALAQNAVLRARIPLPESIAAGRHGRCIVQSLQIVSADQLDWEVWLFANQLYESTGHPDLECFVGYWRFTTAASDGLQVGSSGFYHYYIPGLGLQYRDEDGHNNPAAGCFLNVALVNRSAGSKTNGAWFQMSFAVEPTEA